MSTPTDGLGTVAFWGFTPAIDLFQFLPKSHPSAREIHILLVGVSDIRHVIRTLGTHLPAHAHSDVTIHFHIAEGSVEVLTREILFATLLTEPHSVLGLQERVDMYLELLGNLHVRTQTCEYLQRVSDRLIGLVTDLDRLNMEMPFLDLNGLKYKERDQMEGVLKFWRADDVRQFDAGALWDQRLRRYLGVRFDSKEGVFDWDFNMKMLSRTQLINCHEYCVWRGEGLAFKIRSDALYSTPNRSLSSGVIFRRNGEEVRVRGYWGDIIVGPFICFGTETESKQLREKSSLPYARSADEISVHNLTRYIYQMTSQQVYKESVGEEKLEKVYEVSEEHEAGNIAKCDASSDSRIDLKSVFHFLPLSSPGDLYKKSKFSKLFSLAYFSNTSLHTLTGDTCHVMTSDSVIVLESSKYLLELSKEQHGLFREAAVTRAGATGFKLCQDLIPADGSDPDHFIFRI